MSVRGQQISVGERSLVKAELNFEDYPYFRVGDSRGGEGVVTIRDVIRTDDGRELDQEWTVRAPQGMDLPGRFDQDVYFALLQLIYQMGGIPEDGWIQLSLYDLIELLGRSHGGRDYQQVKDSLSRLSMTSIQSKNAFYIRSTKTYANDTFHLLDRVYHSDSSDAHGRSIERTRIKVSDHFVESYNANYHKLLDAEFYWSLNSAIAKRLYRLIDKKRNNHRRWEHELFALRDRIPLSNYRYPSKIKEKLGPAHDELSKKGFLEEVSYRKLPSGDNLVCYLIQDSFSRRRPEPLVDEDSPDVRIALERLRVEGLSTQNSRELVSEYGPERCLRYAEAVTFQKGIRNRPGWLRSAIQNAYDLDNPPLNIHNTSEQDNHSLSSIVLAGGSSEGIVSHDVCQRDVFPMPEPDPDAQQCWESIVSELSRLKDSDSLEYWFDGSVAISFAEGALTVCCTNDLQLSYVEEKFRPNLDSLLSSRFGPGHHLKLHTPC